MPIVDPTKNVLDLVEAEANKRDEFRVVDAQLLDAKLETLRAEARVLEISLTLRDAHRAEMSRSESRRIDEQATLRADYSHQLSVAESARIDAIRAVDVNAVAVASQRASDQACVSADTPILCADLIWRPAGMLKVGDELVGLDEDPAPLASARSTCSRGRKYCKSVVTKNSLREDDLLLVSTSAGSVRCNREHPWLARRKDKEAKWRWLAAGELRPGDQVMHTLDVWEVETTWEAGWLAGIIDGEGSLGFTNAYDHAKLTVAQVVGPVADRIGDAFLSRGFASYRRRARGVLHGFGSKPQHEFVVGATADLVRILGSLRPSRFVTNHEKVWAGKCIGGRHRAATTVTSIENAGVGTIASLSTSTKTYIAAGFAMHNTVLANQVAQSAEALRTLVASTANTVAIAQQQLGTTLSTRITTLEQAQYEGKGRSAFADPAFAELLAEVKALRDSRATVSGRTEGVSSTWAILAAGALVAIGLATAIIMARQPAVQPTVSYVPAPTASPTPAPITVPR